MLTLDTAFPRCVDRRAWEGIGWRRREEILAAGKALAKDGGYPAVTASQFLAFGETGDRQVFEGPYFARRQRLIRACLAFCASGAASYLPEIADGLWMICEESGWWVSAHHPGPDPLPDPGDPVIDLFAAQTAALVSWVCYLVEPALPPAVLRRVRREVERRALAPFFARDDFWWMGYTRKDLNNWTPWILANLLAAGHIWGARPDERAAVMLSRWLACVPGDGGLDEGVAYWNVAGASLLDCLEHLGRTERCMEPKIRALAAFPLRMYIHGAYFVNFADCDGKPRLDGERIHALGILTGNPGLARLGAELESRAESIFPQDTPEFYRTLCRLFPRQKRACDESPSGPRASGPPPEAAGALAVPVSEAITLPDLQVWIRRRGGLYVALKGGHNGESHNHNDVGSFIVYVDGEPAVVDAGNMTYTAETFREETRYTLWNTRSGNHNLPLIGPFEQAAGAERRARWVRFEGDAARMDIAPAYPVEAGVRSLVRTLSMGKELVLTDDIDLEAPLPVTWVFLLRSEPVIGRGSVLAGRLALAFESAFSARAGAVAVGDDRMARSFPGSLYRLTITAPPATTHRAVFRMRKQGP